MVHERNADRLRVSHKLSLLTIYTNDDTIKIFHIQLSYTGHRELLCPFGITCYIPESIFILNFPVLGNENHTF